ncbi:MAG: bifunctional precorrin-2 dehydrogenase/sirohydrochlorin ferrochelatase [bacterium]
MNGDNDRDGHTGQSPRRRPMPLFVSMSRRPCLVIGGGAVALRKINRLLSAGADVTVCARETSGETAGLVRAGAVRVMPPERVPHNLDVSRFFLVVAATDDPALNRSVAALCRRAGVLVNCAAEPEHGDVFFCSESGAGELRVAVSTAGAAPLLAKWFARRIQSLLPPRLDAFISEFSSLRKKLLETRGADDALWDEILSTDLDAGIRSDGGAAVLEKMRRKISPAGDTSRADDKSDD